MRSLMLGMSVWVAACGGDGTGPDPQVDAGSSSDAAASQGLTVAFEAKPTLPGTVRGGVAVDSAIFWVKSLEVIGDAGAGGTTRSDVRLEWSSDAQPSAIVFADAAPGLYSQVTLDLDGELANPSYEIRGTARIGGGTTMEPFLITDTANLNIDVRNFSVTLSPGGDATMRIELDLEEAFEIAFDQFDNVGGVWTLDQNHALIGDFRDDLDSAFKKK